MTHQQKIRSLLKRGWSITQLQALNKYGCLRLSAVIYELRKEMDIYTENFKTPSGKVVAKYWYNKKPIK